MKSLLHQLWWLGVGLALSIVAALGVASGLGIVAHLVCAAFRSGWQWVGRYFA